MRNATSLALAFVAASMMLLGPAASASAQTTYGVSWGLAQSVSDTKDFADDLSLRNVDAEVRRMVSPTVSLGGSIGWHVFHEEVSEQTDVTGVPVTVSGLSFRTVNSVPITVTAHKYFGAERQRRGYIGVGAGTGYQEARVDIGILSIDDTSWSFTAIPEAGFILPLSGSMELMINAKYQWSSGDLGTQALYFNIGLVSRPFSL